MPDVRHWMRIVTARMLGESTLPEIKAKTAAELARDDISDEERETLLHEHGLLDDMQFDDRGNLTIYRAMYVTPSWIAQARSGKRLGIYWSHSANTASPYDAVHNDASEKEVNLVMRAILPADRVDWPFILAMHERGENEVRLEPNDRIKITGLWVNDEPMHAPNWIGKWFRA